MKTDPVLTALLRKMAVCVYLAAEEAAAADIADGLTKAADLIDQQSAEIRKVMAAFEQLLSDMEEATGGGMAWITYDEVQVFKRRARSILTKETSHAM